MGRSIQEDAIQELETAAAEHLTWLKGVHLALLAPEQRRMPPGDALQLLSGWVAAAKTAAERADRQSLVDELRQSRQHMEDKATRLIGQTPQPDRIDPAGYLSFMSSVEDYCLHLRHAECLLRQSLAETDPLTGVANRQGMMRDLHREWTRALRTGMPACVALADLDHFKEINDTFGHLAGDRILRLAARFFRRRLRPYDLIYRFGGEEFVFCLPNTAPGDARRVLDRLRTMMARLPVRLADGRQAVVTASIGIAAMQADTPPERALELADDALYRAKRTGRNRVCVAQEDRGRAERVEAENRPGVQ